MYIIPKWPKQRNKRISSSDPCPASPEPNPADPWLFTDPFAIELYKNQHILDQLEEDIQYYVMKDGWWTLEDLEFKLEIRRLLCDRVISPAASFGSLSPHPTVYRTLEKGSVLVSNQTFNFKPGEYLVYVPWLARYSDPGLKGPLEIGQPDIGSGPQLCKNQFSQICIHCDHTRTEMRKILAYRIRT
jgi:hypothetical protein